jgi:hypothetical protein
MVACKFVLFNTLGFASFRPIAQEAFAREIT